MHHEFAINRQTGFLSVYKSLIHSQSFRNFIRPKNFPYPAGNVVLIGTNVAEKNDKNRVHRFCRTKIEEAICNTPTCHPERESGAGSEYPTLPSLFQNKNCEKNRRTRQNWFFKFDVLQMFLSFWRGRRRRWRRNDPHLNPGPLVFFPLCLGEGGIAFYGDFRFLPLWLRPKRLALSKPRWDDDGGGDE